MDTHEVDLLMDTATRWFASHADQAASLETDGPDATLVWQAYADLGWLALTLPEACGGVGADTQTALRLARLNGRALASTPLELHLMLAPWLLRIGGATPSAWAEDLASGAMRLGLADAGRQAVITGGCITVQSTEVYGGATATHILVIGCDSETARECVALLSADAAGVVRSPARWLDGRPCVRVLASEAAATVLQEAKTLEVSREPAPAPGPKAAPEPMHEPAFEPAPDLARQLRLRASTALAADAAGAFEAAFDMTLVYLKQRVQFGKPLSTLQAVQHGMADIFCDLQQLLALVERLGLEDADGNGADPNTLVATKSQLGRHALRGLGQLIQLSGGIGVTDEYRLGRYYKRLHVAATLFGTFEDVLRELDIRQALVTA